MLRAAGAVCLILSGTLAGVDMVKRRRTHCRLLEELILSLGLMRGEIAGNLTPLPEVLELLGHRGPVRMQPFYNAVYTGLSALDEHSLPEIWRDACEKALPELTALETEWFCGLSGSLGVYDAAQQARALDACMKNFQCELERCREELRQKGSVYMGLGVSAGVLAAVLLL